MNSQDPHTVLVVDDESEIADLFAEWLSPDYAIRTAYGGKEALSVVDADVDVILLDRLMPDISGDVVLEKVRERGLDCHVAMVTAVEPAFDVLGMGFDAYVTKPPSREELTAVVSNLLERRQYETTVNQYFRLLSQRETLKQHVGAAVTNDSRFKSLQSEIAELEDEIATLDTPVEPEEFEAELHRLQHLPDGVETRVPDDGGDGQS